MCLVVLGHRIVPDAPILLAANREERYDRPSTPPRTRPGTPTIVCGTDLEGGGTWLGVNGSGLLVAVTNRGDRPVPTARRSRGLLCLDLLHHDTAAAAAERAAGELAGGRYAGANYLCCDPDLALVVHGGPVVEIVTLEPGVHVLTNGDVDDLDDPRVAIAGTRFRESPWSTVGAFLERAADVCADRGAPDGARSIVLRGERGGTVSSDLIALASSAAASIYRHAPGPPDEHPYRDCSGLLRTMS